MLMQNFGGQIRCIMGDVQVPYCLDYNQGGLGTRSCTMGLTTPDPRSQKEQSWANIEHDTAVHSNKFTKKFMDCRTIAHTSIYCFVVVER